MLLIHHGLLEGRAAIVERRIQVRPTRFIYDFRFYIGGKTAYRDRLGAEFLSRLEATGPHH